MNSAKRQVLSPLQKFKETVKAAIVDLLPGAASAFGGFVYAEIVKVNDGMGPVDKRSKGYSCDVQVLQPSLEPDANIEEIKDVPMDPVMFGNSVTLLGKPVAGMIVRMGFMYRDPAFPFIVAVTAEKQTLPGQGVPLHPGQVPGETFGEMFMRHTHLNQGIGAPTSNVSAALPPGGPMFKADIQR